MILLGGYGFRTISKLTAGIPKEYPFPVLVLVVSSALFVSAGLYLLIISSKKVEPKSDKKQQDV